MIIMPRIIGIVSGKGGVGKTTVTANLGVALARFGKKVTIVDCNVTTSHLGFSFGLYYYPKTLNHVLKGEASIYDAVYHHESNVDIIPASLSIEDLIGIDIENLGSTIKDIQGDVVLLDSAPGLGKEPLSVFKVSQEIIYVTIPYISAVSDIIRCQKVARQLGLMPLGIILNMVRGGRYELSKRETEALTGLPVIAKIPFDKNIPKSLALGNPLLTFKPYSPASIEFMKLAAELTGMEYRLPKRRFLVRFYDTLKGALARPKPIEFKIQ
jgi:septum site-determining protein MinD